ncbi:interferon phi 1 [Cebidichthys violaceus]|uniref:interferon phi 1 n=1 Tax=Cebidichthys violaceus TaxID=271503 RepID=UPI0035CB5EEE
MTSWTRLILVLLCSAVSPVLGCDCVRNYGRLSNTSLTLVQVMGGQLTDQESPVPFPYRFYKRVKKDEVESQVIFIRDSLELIAGLYRHDNRSSVTWDTDKTESFLMTIDRQTEDLKSCVSTHRRKNMSGLKRYYRKLEKKTLYRTGGSPESWELIRKETKLHLKHLDLLAASLRCSTETGH